MLSIYSATCSIARSRPRPDTRSAARPSTRSATRSNTLRAVLCAALSVCLTLPALAQSDYLALITDVNGRALVAREDAADFKPAVWGMQLFAGDRVKTEDASDVSILFSNNNLIVLGANSAITISAGPGAADETVVASIEQDLYGTLANLKDKPAAGKRERALAGLRSDGSASSTHLVSPRNTKVKDRRPAFVWHSEKEYDAYVVNLYDASGRVWSRRVESTRMNYPEDEAPLMPGRAYFWDVEGETLLDSEKSEKVGFTVLSEDDSTRIARQESTFVDLLEDRGTNYQFAMGAFYAREGLMESAIASFEEIAARHPQAALPHVILGRLYEEVGLQDRALAAHHRAVALRQEN